MIPGVDRRRVVLRDDKTPGDRRWLAANLGKDGALVVEGQDLGEGVEAAFGHGIREYEWTTEVSAEDIPRLVAALGGAQGAGILDVIRATCLADPSRLESTIRAAGITPRFWSRMGE
jgi:hypothetical protein